MSEQTQFLLRSNSSGTIFDVRRLGNQTRLFTGHAGDMQNIRVLRTDSNDGFFSIHTHLGVLKIPLSKIPDRVLGDAIPGPRFYGLSGSPDELVHYDRRDGDWAAVTHMIPNVIAQIADI